jgi:hypothetical protein
VAAERGRSRAGKWVVSGVGLAALFYLLLRRGSGTGGSGSARAAPGSDGESAAPPRPCRVRIDQDGLQVDGTPSDLPTTVARCRAAGTADVTATGAAIVGTIAQIVRALREAGVTVRAAQPVWDVIDLAPPRSP